MQILSAVVEAAALEAQQERLRLGRRVVEAREAAGMSARDLAVRLVRRRGKHDPGSAAFEKAVASMLRTLRRTENGHNTPRGDLLLAIAEETGIDSGHFTSEKPGENDELRRRARELVSPFPRSNGRRPARGVSAGRGKSGRR